MNQYARRAEYLDFLKRHQDRDIIKVVSGVRRSGKSTLFKMFQNDLFSQGVTENQIISINFEDLQYQDLLTAENLYAYLMEKIQGDKKMYVFLDEIQMVERFERAVDSLFINKNLDLYITGSNAYFLSGELATLLTGRYVQLDILPLSFKEFVDWHENYGQTMSLESYYQTYLKSSFPYTLGMTDDLERLDYLQGLYSTILLNDIVKRLNIQDVGLLERLIETLFSSIGSLVTVNKIKNTLISKGYKVAHNTVDRYIQGIKDSFLFYEAKRFDIHGRQLLDTQVKYYSVDVGLRTLLLRDHFEDSGHILENIVYLELRRRANRVYVGKNDQLEIDFVAVSKSQDLAYYQVALTTLDPQTLKRELRSLESIEDNYPKYLLTLDTVNTEGNYGGIIKRNVLDWLLDRE